MVSATSSFTGQSLPWLARGEGISALQGRSTWSSLKNCKANAASLYIAPFDVRLPSPMPLANDATNVVQPDLLMYCDPEKHDERGGIGAPDFVIEVLSPGSGAHEYVRKLRLYEAAVKSRSVGLSTVQIAWCWCAGEPNSHRSNHSILTQLHRCFRFQT